MKPLEASLGVAGFFVGKCIEQIGIDISSDLLSEMGADLIFANYIYLLDRIKYVYQDRDKS